MNKVLTYIFSVVMSLAACFAPLCVRADSTTLTVDSAIINNVTSSPDGLSSFAFADPSDWHIMTFCRYNNVSTLTANQMYIAAIKFIGNPSSSSSNLTPDVNNLSVNDRVYRVSVSSDGSLNTTDVTASRVADYKVGSTYYYIGYVYYCMPVKSYAYIPYNCGNIDYYSSSSYNAADAALVLARYLWYGELNTSSRYSGTAPLGGILGIGNINPRIWLSPDINALINIPRIVQNSNILQSVNSVNAPGYDYTPVSDDREFTYTESGDNITVTINNEYNYGTGDGSGGGSGGSGGTGGTSSQTQTQSQSIEENAINITINGNLSPEEMDDLVNGSVGLPDIINGITDFFSPFRSAVNSIRGFKSVVTEMADLISATLSFLPSWVTSIIGLAFTLLAVMITISIVKIFV